MAQLTGRKQISHLLRRAGFGGSPDEIEAYLALGFEAAVERLVQYEQVSNDDLEGRVAELEGRLDVSRLPSIQMIWLNRMLLTAHPLEERMTLFWHNHFATANSKVGRPQAMYDQNKLFRSQALGSFRELLKSVARDPAMLRWLDSNSNRRRSPNENFARELMELFTLGVGNYTEQDVREGARAFTGWFFDRNLGFVFNNNQHDPGQKTFLGRTGAWNGDDVIDIILQQPAAAEFLARKAFVHFVHDSPSQATISRLANLFRSSDYSVRALVRAILLSPEFSSDEAYHGVVKSPVELLVGAMKSLGIGSFSQVTAGGLRRMGMDLFNPPDVSGWHWNEGWIGSNTLLERLNEANALTSARGENASAAVNPAGLVGRLGARTPPEIVDGLLQLLVDGDASAETRQRLLDYITAGYSGRPEAFTSDAERIDRTVRGAVHLTMALPAYQMA